MSGYSSDGVLYIYSTSDSIYFRVTSRIDQNRSGIDKGPGYVFKFEAQTTSNHIIDNRAIEFCAVNRPFNYVNRKVAINCECWKNSTVLVVANALNLVKGNFTKGSSPLRHPYFRMISFLGSSRTTS